MSWGVKALVILLVILVVGTGIIMLGADFLRAHTTAEATITSLPTPPPVIHVENAAEWGGWVAFPSREDFKNGKVAVFVFPINKGNVARVDAQLINTHEARAGALENILVHYITNTVEMTIQRWRINGQLCETIYFRSPYKPGEYNNLFLEQPTNAKIEPAPSEYLR
jgi:hypothetical protein